MARRGESLRQRIMRDLKKTERDKYRAKIRELRARAREAKAERKRRLKAAKEACRARMQKAIAAANRKFQREYSTARERQKAATVRRNEERKARVRAAREQCELEDADIRTETQEAIRLAKAEEAEQRKFRREMTAGERALRARKRQRKKRIPPSERRRQQRQESDDFAKQNIPRELHALWEERKRFIKDKPGLRRDEAFMEWVHENPDAVWETRAAQVPDDSEYAAAEAAWFREQSDATAELEEVPF